MGIQPIDLQSMYSQISNVAKTVGGQQQAAQLSDAMQQQSVIQRNLENSKKVQQTSADQINSRNVSEDGSNSATYGQNKRKKKGRGVYRTSIKRLFLFLIKTILYWNYN